MPVAQRDWFIPVWAARTPDECANAYADVCVLIARRTARIFEAVHRGADEGGEVAQLWARLQSNPRAGAAMVVDRMLELAPTAATRPREQSVDIMWTLNDPSLYDTLVLACGWGEVTFRDWLAEQMRRAPRPDPVDDPSPR